MNKPIPIFHAFTTRYNGITNRITTDVKVCKAFDPRQPPTPAFPLHQTTALWDTGATRSVITTSTAQTLLLSPVGSTIVDHAGGRSQSNTYVVNFFLPNNVGAIGVLVSECPNIAGNFGVIIGMDIITQGDLSLTHVNQQTCVSFRIPSISTIDYVAEANRLKAAMTSRIGRNDPCPCGSGRKYKKCCGR